MSARFGPTLRAWCELARLSNAPTVLSNAIAGAALGELTALTATHSSHGEVIRGLIVRADRSIFDARSLALLLAILLPLASYIGGMMLNDAFDAATDARERRARPIPSGRVARSHAFIAGVACLIVALGAAAMTGSMLVLAATLVLVGAVVTYNALHALSASSVLLLALCRALACVIPMLAFAGDSWKSCATNGAVVLPAALAVWTLALSLMARHEVASSASASLSPSSPASASTSISAPSLARSRRRAAILLSPMLIAGACVFMLTQGPLAEAEYLSQGDVEAMLRRVLPLGLGVWMATDVIRARVQVERNPRATPMAVGVWISCLALIDAMALFAVGQSVLAVVAVCLAVLTRRLQRSIAGS